jgi:hypothetical protein
MNYFAQCTHDEYSRIVGNSGRSLTFRGETVVIDAHPTITFPIERSLASIKLWGLTANQTSPPAADPEVIELLRQWDSKGRFHDC